MIDHRRKQKSFVYPCREMYLLFPALCGFALFYIFPLEYVFRSAFWQTSFNHTFAWFSNFAKVAENNYFQIACMNMIVVMIGMTLSVFILALPLSVFIRENRCFSWLHGILLLTVFIPSAALGKTWLIIPGVSQTDLIALLTMATWKTLGIPVSMILVGFAALDPHQEEAALIDGVSFGQRYRLIVLPQMGPSLLFSLIYVLVQSQRLYREAYVLFGDYPAREVYLLQHYMNHHFQKLNYPLLSAAAILELCLILMLILAVSMLRRKKLL